MIYTSTTWGVDHTLNCTVRTPFFCTPSNPISVCVCVCHYYRFEVVVVVLVVIYCCILMLDSPDIRQKPQQYQAQIIAIDLSEIIFSSIFTVEIILRIIAHGFYRDKDGLDLPYPFWFFFFVE